MRYDSGEFSMASNEAPSGRVKATGGKRARVLLGDDHALVAAGLAKLLETDFDVVGVAADGPALLAAARDCHPDAILLDISMPILNGLEAARRLHAEMPACKLVFVTMHSEAAFLKESIRVGGSGYVLKRSAASELTNAVKAALNGRMYITPMLSEALPQTFVNADGSDSEKPTLSGRQRQVLQLVSEGRSAKQIASILNISTKTVEFHKGLVKKKLDLHSIAELTRYWLEHETTASDAVPCDIQN
jgi:DNA-binding NarL/FixJ family response regulator